MNHQKKKILKALGLKTGKNSIIVDGENRAITNRDFETIKEKEFGGILKSSKLPIKKDTSELVKYFVRK